MAISYINRDSATNGTSTTSLSVTAPSNMQENDIVIVLLALEANNPDNSYITPDTGFSLINEIHYKATTGSLTAWWRKVTASEPGSYTFSWSNGTEVSMESLAFRGCNPNNPIDQSTTTGNKETSTITLGTITPTKDPSMLVGVGMMAYTDNTDDFLSVYDSLSFTWTQLSDVGSHNHFEPVIGSGYSSHTGTTSVTAYMTNQWGNGEAYGLLFNLQEFSYTNPADIQTGYTFTTAGTYYITVPYGASTSKISCWGAGGCGSGANRQAGKWAGGGGGGYSLANFVKLAPGTLLKIVVGAGGTSAGTNDGGDSYVLISDSTWDHTTFSVEINRAYGGKGCSAGSNTGAAGGTGTGTVVYSGGTGASTNAFSTGGGGGGGGAGDSANGSNGTVSTGGTGGTAHGQTGGNGRTGSAGNGGSPVSVVTYKYGGGGGGSWGDASNAYSGGSGGDGGVEITIDYALNTMVISSI